MLNFQGVKGKFKKNVRSLLQKTQKPPEPAPESVVTAVDAAPQLLTQNSSAEPLPDAAIPPSSSMTDAVEDAAEELSMVHVLNSTLLSASSAVNETAVKVQSITGIAGSLLEKVTLFATVVEAIGQIHPYAQMTCTILTSIAKPILAQAERDEAMQDLLNTIKAVYGIAIDFARIENLGHERTILLKELTLQTTECAYFIRDSAFDKNFFARSVKNVVSGSAIDKQIIAYNKVFDNIRKSLTERGVMEIEIRVLKGLSDIGMSIDLLKLTRIRGVGFNPDNACLDGTRIAVLDELSQWVNDPNGHRVLFLTGVAGIGKSAIAHSVAERFRDLHRLGSFLAFDRTFKSDRRVESALSTIAVNLANWNSDFKKTLAQIIEADSTLADTTSITEQWDHLIVEPASKISFWGPVLVVIDALDESSVSQARARRLLFDALLERSEKLPKNFRILVTSRPEEDVIFNLSAQDARPNDIVRHIDLNSTVTQADAAADIKRYLQHELKPIKPFDKPPLDSQLESLATKSEGLFHWAFTACQVIRLAAGFSLRERIDQFLNGVTASSSSPLDSLYTYILEIAFPSSLASILPRFHSVMSQVLSASEPLFMQVHEDIRSLAIGECENEVALILSNMGAVLSGVGGSTSPVRPMHTSFYDFLCDQDRSQKWSVNAQEGHEIMLLGCMRILNSSSLHFNICGLSTSYRFNSDVPDLDLHVQSVPRSLRYAACYWSDHYSAPAEIKAASQDTFFSALEGFLKEKLLYWLELLSTLRRTDRAVTSLQAAAKILKDRMHIQAILQDAILFVRRFRTVMTQSTPHIYISALPFTPVTSVIRATLAQNVHHIPSVNGVFSQWSRMQMVIPAQSLVQSIAYSGDGRYLVSGSWDSMLRIWDAETGEAVGEPLRGHTGAVWAVAYSPDRSRIVSSSQDSTVRIWDAKTGEAIGEPLRGHRESVGVWSATYSPDGRYIISGSQDSTIRVWRADSGEPVGEPLRGHAGGVWTVAYSHDGRYIASGSQDMTIRIWSTHTWELAMEPLCGHKAGVAAIAFSPDSRHIVSASSDSTVRIWNIENCEGTCEFICNHPADVWAVAYSPDSRYIVAGTHASMVHLWDAQTGLATGEPLRGHSSSVSAVTFSPDGRHIVTGSQDSTLRVWSVQTSTTADEFPSGRAAGVKSVAYSPDGRHVVSGLQDTTMRVWDAQSGEAVGEPLCGHEADVNAVAYSRDGSIIVSGSRDRTLRIWDAQSYKAIGEPLRGHTDLVRCIACSPIGNYIASGSEDFTIRVWDADKREAIGEPFNGHADSVISVAWSPDGRHLVSGSDDSTVRIWDAKTGEAVGEPLRHHTAGVAAVAYSPDGRYIASGSADQTIYVWDAQSDDGVIGAPLLGHSEGVRSVAFSLDSRHILSGSLDETVRIWDVSTRAAVGEPLRGHVSLVMSVAYSPDGQRAVSGSYDSTIRIWDVGAGDDGLEEHLNDCRTAAQLISSSQGEHSAITEPQVSQGDSDISQHAPEGEDVGMSSASGSPPLLPPAAGVQDRYFLQNFSASGAGDDGTAVSRHGPSVKMEDGWVKDEAGNLIIWIPEEYRARLRWPRAQLIIDVGGGNAPSITVDFKDAFHGTDWVKVVT